MIINPKYAQRRPGAGSGRTLTEEEYKALMALLLREPVLETDGKIVTLSTGEIVYSITH